MDELNFIEKYELDSDTLRTRCAVELARATGLSDEQIFGIFDQAEEALIGKGDC